MEKRLKALQARLGRACSKKDVIALYYRVDAILASISYCKRYNLAFDLDLSVSQLKSNWKEKTQVEKISFNHFTGDV